MAKFTGEQLAKMSVMELVTLASTDATLLTIVTDEINRRESDVPTGGKPLVDFNSSGGVMIMEGAKTTLSSTGTLYAGSVNMPFTMVSLLFGDSPESVDLRKRAIELTKLPAAQRDSRIADKKAKKENNQASEVSKTRKTIASAVKKGLMPESALAEFDAKNPAS